MAPKFGVKTVQSTALRAWLNSYHYRHLNFTILHPTSVSKLRSIIMDLANTSSPKRRLIDSPSKWSPNKRLNVSNSPLKELSANNKSLLSERPFRVSIEGNIGAGKSTLLKHFKGLPGIETYGEPMDWWRDLNGHNLLDLMYSNIHDWLKVFQSYVQLTRLKVQTTKPKSSETTVQIFERSVQNNRFCFVEQAFKSGFLSGADYTLLDEWYKWIRSNVDINLDLIVYLRSTPEVVYERVKARGRPEESEISLQYLIDLHESHEKWLMSSNENLNTVPVLVLDANKTLDEIIEQYRVNESRILGKKTNSHRLEAL